MRPIDADKFKKKLLEFSCSLTEQQKSYEENMEVEKAREMLGRKRILDDVLYALYKQPTVSEWIPCSKRLPNESDYYMACIYNLEVDEYDFRKTWFAHTDDCDIDESGWQVMYSFEKVVAWMPLPRPYKEANE